MSKTTADESVAGTTHTLLAASRALVGVAARSLGAIEDSITLPQYRALVLLASRGEENVGVLADALAIHPSTATRLCDRLARKGLIERNTSAESRQRSHASRSLEAGRVSAAGGDAASRPRDQQDRHAARSRDAPCRDRRPECIRRCGRRDPRRSVEARMDVVTVAPVRSAGSAPAAPSSAGSRRRSREVLLLAAIVGAATGLRRRRFDTVVTRVGRLGRSPSRFGPRRSCRSSG